MNGGGGGARVSIAGGLKKMIQDIREIAGEHSDEDIYAMLQECSMDPNETAQRLFHLDTFHEVKKKHGKKENLGVKASDVTANQRGPRVGKGAKVAGGNFPSQNSSQINFRRSFGRSRENGFANVSKGHKSENKTPAETSRPVLIKVNGKSKLNETPQANDKSDDSSVSVGGSNPLSPASVTAKEENVSSVENHVESAAPVVQIQPLTPLASETLPIDMISSGDLVHENHVSNGNASLSVHKIKEAAPRNEIVDAAKSQLAVFNCTDQPRQGKVFAVNETIVCGEKKQHVSEANLSVLSEEATKLSVSDSHVVFPEHLQVPEAYKKKLTFGSFGSSWPLGDKHESKGSDVSADMPNPADDSCLVKTVPKSSVERTDHISSTVKDVTERENPSYIQPPLCPISDKPTSLFEHASSDVVIKIDEPETESLLDNGGPDIAYHPSNNVFGYPPKPQLQALATAEPQDGSFITSSASGVDQNSNIQPQPQPQPPGVPRDTISSPPPVPFLRQAYYPNFSPYGHYYPQFFVPQVQQYVSHGGFLPQQPLVPNVYLTSPPSGGIKYPPHPLQKQGANGGADGYVGVPSGYNPYIPYSFPLYGLPPATIPVNVAGDEEHAAQLKENTALTTEQQTESPGAWMSGTSQTVPGLQINPFYNLTPSQGHPMPTGFGPFTGVYQPSVQAIPAPQPTMHHPQHNHQPHSMRSAEPPPPPPSYYQQQPQQPPPPQGAHILRKDNNQ